MREVDNLNSVLETVLHELVHTVEGCFNHGNKFHNECKKINKKFDTKLGTFDETSGGEIYAKEIYKNRKTYLMKCENCEATRVFRRDEYDIEEVEDVIFTFVTIKTTFDNLLEENMFVNGIFNPLNNIDNEFIDDGLIIEDILFDTLKNEKEEVSEMIKKKSSIIWLIGSQGYRYEDIKNPEKRNKSIFLKSLYEEIKSLYKENGINRTAIVFTGRTPIYEMIEFNNEFGINEAVKVTKDNKLGLNNIYEYDKGCSTLFNIQVVWL